MAGEEGHCRHSSKIVPKYRRNGANIDTHIYMTTHFLDAAKLVLWDKTSLLS